MKAWPLLLLLALFAGCVQAPNPETITRIVLSRNSCDPNPHCTFVQYVIRPDGSVKYTNGLNFDYYGRMPLQEYGVLAAQLVSTPGAFDRHWDYTSDVSEQAATTIWTDFAGRHWQVRFPATGLAASMNATVNRLNGWARMAASEAGDAIMRARQKEIALREDTNRLQRVVFESRGCLGTCPAYAAVFTREGGATLKGARYVPGIAGPRAVDLRAHVRFDRVGALLLASNFGALDPRYPLRLVDGYGVSFEFEYRDGSSFSVLAPDQTQWPPQVAQLVGSFQQLIRDTGWRAGR